MSEAAPSCPYCGHPLGQDPKFQASRRPRRIGTALVGVLLLAMGLGALVKPPPPTPGPPSTPGRTSPPAQPMGKVARPKPSPSMAPGFGNLDEIAACLKPLGFKKEEIQQVLPGRWQAGAMKQLFQREYGDVYLTVSGPSPAISSSVELVANARVRDWAAARSELRKALPVLMNHLQLSLSEDLTQAVEVDAEAQQDGKGIAERTVEVNGVNVHCISRCMDDLRSVEVRFTRK